MEQGKGERREKKRNKTPLFGWEAVSQADMTAVTAWPKKGLLLSTVPYETAAVFSYHRALTYRAPGRYRATWVKETPNADASPSGALIYIATFRVARAGEPGRVKDSISMLMDLHEKTAYGSGQGPACPPIIYMPTVCLVKVGPVSVWLRPCGS